MGGWSEIGCLPYKTSRTPIGVWWASKKCNTDRGREGQSQATTLMKTIVEVETQSREGVRRLPPSVAMCPSQEKGLLYTYGSQTKPRFTLTGMWMPPQAVHIQLSHSLQGYSKYVGASGGLTKVGFWRPYHWGHRMVVRNSSQILLIKLNLQGMLIEKMQCHHVNFKGWEHPYLQATCS